MARMANCWVSASRVLLHMFDMLLSKGLGFWLPVMMLVRENATNPRIEKGTLQSTRTTLERNLWPWEPPPKQ